MTRVDPLPFRLGVTGSDTLSLDGARSVSYRMEGTLHLVDETVTIEWTGSKRTQHVDFGEVTDDVDHFPVEWLDVPVAWITSARLKGGWWAPRLILRSDRIDAFDGVPTAKQGSLKLRVLRRDRELARGMVQAIVSASKRTPNPVNAGG